MKKGIILLILPFLWLSCAGSPESDMQMSKKIPFHWEGNPADATAMDGKMQWQLSIPESQGYVVSLKINNGETETRTVTVQTDQGQFVRLKIPPNDWGMVQYGGDFFINKGTITLTLEDLGVEMEFLSLTLDHTFPLRTGKLDTTPANPNASPEAVALMAFLGENYGKHILSGQMDLTWDDNVDMCTRVMQYTGYKPAIMGYDLMNYKTNQDGGKRKTPDRGSPRLRRPGRNCYVLLALARRGKQ